MEYISIWCKSNAIDWLLDRESFMRMACTYEEIMCRNAMQIVIKFGKYVRYELKW